MSGKGRNNHPHNPEERVFGQLGLPPVMSETKTAKKRKAPPLVAKVPVKKSSKSDELSFREAEKPRATDSAAVNPALRDRRQSSGRNDSQENSVEGFVGRALTAEIQANRQKIRKRQQKIRESQKKIDKLQKRIIVLQKQHEQHVRRASLLCDAEEDFKTLRSRGISKKEDVLLALQSDVVPDCMRWGTGDFFSTFYYDGASMCFDLDRDILFARLALDDFEAAYVNEPYPVPERFRDDKEVMLAVCAKNSHALALASERLRDDQDVVLAAVQQRFHFAPFALQHASANLRGDRKIVRAALNQEHGIHCFKYIAPKLQNDHRLALLSIKCSTEACSRVYEHLSDLPEELREDYDIVMAAVNTRGSNLRFVTDRVLLEDEGIIKAACQHDGGLLQFVPEGSDLWKTMLKRENLKTFLAEGNEGGDMLQFASPRVQMDEDLVLLAVKNGRYSQPGHDVSRQFIASQEGPKTV